MNKYLTFLVAVLAISQASAFMGTPVFGSRAVRFCLVMKVLSLAVSAVWNPMDISALRRMPRKNVTSLVNTG